MPLSTRRFNLFWIPISLAIVNLRPSLQFIINLKIFIKFELASHFGLYLKKELKFSKTIFTVLLIENYTFDFVKMKVKVLLLKKLDFSTRKDLSKKLRFFSSWKCVIKPLWYLHIKTKMGFIAFVDKKLLTFVAQFQSSSDRLFFIQFAHLFI